MTGNSESGHSAFVEAVSRAAAEYRQSIAAQYEQREKELQESHREAERKQDAVIEKLKGEVSELQSRLGRKGVDSPRPSLPGRLYDLEAGVTPSSALSIASPPPPTLHSLAPSTDLQTAYSKLHAKFQLLEGNFKKAKDLLERRKNEREQWANQTALLQEKLDALQRNDGEHQSSSKDRPIPLPPAASGLATESNNSTNTFQRHQSHSGGETPNSKAQVSPTAQGGQTPGSTQSDPDDGLEVTLPTLSNDTGRPGPLIKHEPSSDGPMVVSERPVKKRKRDSSGDGPGTAKVKAEAIASSSPIPRLDRIMLNSEGSLDLGEVAQRIATPRKRRELAPDDGHKQGPFNDPLPPLAITQAHSGLYAKATPKSVGPAPLTPIDANRRLSKAPNVTFGKKRRQMDLENGIGMLAEDGVNYELDQHSAGVNVDTPAPKNRLDELLNTPGVGDPKPDISRSITRKLQKPSTPRDNLVMPKPRDLPFERSARSSGRQSTTDTAVASPSIARRAVSPKKRETGTPRTKPGTLRHQALSGLRLEDFKINPGANEGLDYAFTDVVRNKSERAALAGCTDPHCCGEYFRKLAISQRPNPPLTSEQRREEQKLLEEFLGDQAYKLATMDKEERDNVWIDAKMHDLANKYGKHRHRYSRMRSPPGFWNADFPSTQEIEDEKAEAAKREQLTIAERHREAMRPGGRWVFRDE